MCRNVSTIKLDDQSEANNVEIYLFSEGGICIDQESFRYDNTSARRKARADAMKRAIKIKSVHGLGKSAIACNW